MKLTVKRPQEIEIGLVKIDIQPRYIGDTDEDDLPTDFPLLNEEKTNWVAFVEIDTGRILDWPQGDARSMHVKVCDAGVYTLLTNDLKEIAVRQDYVPNDLIPGSYGDYVELTIDESGVITNWPRNPDVSVFFESDDD